MKNIISQNKNKRNVKRNPIEICVKKFMGGHKCEHGLFSSTFQTKNVKIHFYI